MRNRTRNRLAASLKLWTGGPGSQGHGVDTGVSEPLLGLPTPQRERRVQHYAAQMLVYIPLPSPPSSPRMHTGIMLAPRR